MTTLEEQQAIQIESLKRQLLIEQRKNSINVDRIRLVLSDIRGATAVLQSCECSMAGVPEPKQGE